MLICLSLLIIILFIWSIFISRRKKTLPIWNQYKNQHTCLFRKNNVIEFTMQWGQFLPLYPSSIKQLCKKVREKWFCRWRVQVEMYISYWFSWKSRKKLNAGRWSEQSEWKMLVYYSKALTTLPANRIKIRRKILPLNRPRHFIVDNINIHVIEFHFLQTEIYNNSHCSISFSGEIMPPVLLND